MSISQLIAMSCNMSISMLEKGIGHDANNVEEAAHASCIAQKAVDHGVVGQGIVTGNC